MMPSPVQGKHPRTTPLSPAIPDGTDHLSSLPVEMTEEILRRLSLDDAVRTSALAKPWRYRWAECPGFKLVFVAEDPPAAVDAVLAGYACNVSYAQLDVAPESNGKVDGWIRALAAKGIRCLVLCFTLVLSMRWLPVPASLFSCRELTSLLLKSCEIPALRSSSDGFPNLLALELDDVNFWENGQKTFEALIARSPLLRSLRIMFPSINGEDDGGNYSEWTIRAPNLRILSMGAWQDCGWRLDDLPLIEEACIHLEGNELPRILPALTRVENLSVEVRFFSLLLASWSNVSTYYLVHS